MPDENQAYRKGKKMSAIENKVDKMRGEAGFSIIELVVVMVIMAIMITVSLFYFMGHKEAYKTDDHSLHLLDVLQDARMRALQKRRPMRVEINKTKSEIRLIDENGLGDASNDTIVKAVPFNGTVGIGTRPTNISLSPPDADTNFTFAYTTSLHPLSNTDEVFTLRFLLNGTVVSAGSDAVGTGASMVARATIYLWPEKVGGAEQADNNKLVRAVTIYGASGSIKFWRFNGETYLSN